MTAPSLLSLHLNCHRRRLWLPGILIILLLLILLIVHAPSSLGFQVKEEKKSISSRSSAPLGAFVDEEDALPCLVHSDLIVNLGGGANPVLVNASQPEKCGSLRRKWLNNPPLSPLARQIEAHQSNCSRSVATLTFFKNAGLGAHFMWWNSGIHYAMQYMDPPPRIQSRTSSDEVFVWLDQEYCNVTQAMYESPLMCYLPRAERRCMEPAEGSNPDWKELPISKQHVGFGTIQAAGTEYLFQSVAPLVIQEAKRQVGLIFASVGGVVPQDIVTVHLRWGDKFKEMQLVSIEQYIEAVQNVSGRSAGDNSTLPIFLATEDPSAYDAFIQAMPSNWVVYADITLTEMKLIRPSENVNHALSATKRTNGRSGLIAMASLLVAMEARYFVVTTASNWSTIMEFLRTNIIDPRCGNCTRMIDLRPWSKRRRQSSPS